LDNPQRSLLLVREGERSTTNPLARCTLKWAGNGRTLWYSDIPKWWYSLVFMET